VQNAEVVTFQNSHREKYLLETSIDLKIRVLYKFKAAIIFHLCKH
jgi:hypothetical protein